MERTRKFLDTQALSRRPAMVMHGPSRTLCRGTDGAWSKRQLDNGERAVVHTQGRKREPGCL